MAAAQEQVTVIISTYNRAARLVDAVRAVFAQQADTPPFSVIVVDNNSTDGTAEVLHDLAREYAPRLRHVFEPRQGLSHGRNAGIHHATTPLLAFTDDDVTVSANWIATIVASFARHPEIDFLGGKVLPSWPREAPAWLTQDRWAPLALTDWGDEPIIVDLGNPRCLIGASLAVRRRAFDLVGLFNPAFQHRSGSVSAVEDHEFELRLWRQGVRGLYLPALSVNADVQLNRLTKRYHRKWHTDHGRAFIDVLKPNEGYDREGRLVVMASTGRRFLGVPLWSYRSMIGTLRGWMVALAARDEGRAFSHEMWLREQVAGAMSVIAQTRQQEGLRTRDS